MEERFVKVSDSVLTASYGDDEERSLLNTTMIARGDEDEGDEEGSENASTGMGESVSRAMQMEKDCILQIGGLNEQVGKSREVS
jgi:hypothetical protein